MLVKRSDLHGLFEADHLYLDLVGRDIFYGRLARLLGQLLQDEDFAVLFCRDNGRSGVPPSLLATALLLQAHDWVSDAEAHRRAVEHPLAGLVQLGLRQARYIGRRKTAAARPRDYRPHTGGA